MRDAVICEPLRTPDGGFGGVLCDVPAHIWTEAGPCRAKPAQVPGTGRAMEASRSPSAAARLLIP